MWPYSYDSCDVGTLPNQTYPGTSTPIAATQNGDADHGNVLVRPEYPSYFSPVYSTVI